MTIHTPNRASYVTSHIRDFIFSSYSRLYCEIPAHDIFYYKAKLRPSLFIFEHIKRK